MALLDALGARLATDAVGVVGTTIFLGYMPDTPDACVAVFEGKGNGPEQMFGSSIFSIDRPSVRVMCRAARNDYPAARALAVAARASLGAIRDETISGVNLMCVMSTSEPYPMRIDGKERSMFGVDFVAWVKP